MSFPSPQPRFATAPPLGCVLKLYNLVDNFVLAIPVGQINEDPMAILNERHSTDGQALLRRYSKAKK